MRKRNGFWEAVKLTCIDQKENIVRNFIIPLLCIGVFLGIYFLGGNGLMNRVTENDFITYEQIANAVCENAIAKDIEVPEGVKVELIVQGPVPNFDRVVGRLKQGEFVIEREPRDELKEAIGLLISFGIAMILYLILKKPKNPFAKIQVFWWEIRGSYRKARRSEDEY